MANDKMNIQFRIKAVDNFSKNMNKLSQQLDKVQRKAEELGTIENIKVGVTGDKKAVKDLDNVSDEIDEINRKSSIMIAVQSVHSSVVGSWEKFRKKMDRLADLSRDFGQVIQSQVFSSILTMAPTAVAGIYSIVGALGTIGPVVGTVAGGVMGLGSAFMSAGTGAVAFGALATSVLGDVFEANEDIKKLREELAKTDDLEKREEILGEIAMAYDSLSSEQRKALDSMEDLSNTWSDLSKSLEPQVVTVFANAMETLDGVIQRLEPMFTSVADAAVKLSESMQINAESDDFNTFIDFLNSTAAPMMETMTKAAGNFAMGLTNMFVAFGPLAETMAVGLENMSKSFREWTAGLSESDRFNAFIDYVVRNGPKLLGIFGGLTKGLVDMFSAFGPLAEDMLDGLLEMVGGFQEWASTLGENKEFQEFIDFVRQEGPNVLEFIGELREFLLNLAEGFKEVSKVTTPFLTTVLELTNAFMEANPWVAKVLAVLTTLLGVLGFLYAPMALFNALLGGLALKALLAATGAANFWGALKVMGGWVLKAIGFLVRFVGVWGLVVGAIIWVANIFKENFDKIYNWTMNTFQSVQDFISEKLDAVQEKFDVVLSFIDRLTGGKFSNILDAISEAMSTASDIIKRTIQFFKDTFDNGLRFLKALVDGDFGEMWRLIKEQMQNIETTISDIWGNVMDFFGSIDLYELGKDVLRGFINGIGSMGDSLVNKVTGVVGGAIEAAKNILNTGSPSKVFDQIGRWTGEGYIRGMDKMTKGVSKTAEVMVGASIPDASAHKNASFKAYPSRDNYDTNSNDDGMNREMLAILGRIDDGIRAGQVIMMDKEAVGRSVSPTVSRELGAQSKKVKRVRGEG